MVTRPSITPPFVTPRKLCAFLAVLLLAVLALPASAGEGERDRPRSDEELKKIMAGLEHGVHALRALGRVDEAEHLMRIAREVGEELEARHRGRKERGGEREMVDRHLEILRLAMPALREGEKRQEAKRLERVIHLLELMREGSPREKVERAQAEAPGPEETLEILQLAARLWREFKHPDKAEMLMKAIREARKEAHAGGGEREIVAHRIEVFRLAMKAFAEAERRDAAEMMEHAIHARELMLKGRRDEEARRIIERAPKREKLVGLLRHAAQIWAGFGHESKAHAILEVASEMAGQGKEGRRRSEMDERIEHLQRRLAELHEMMVELRKELEHVRRELK